MVLSQVCTLQLRVAGVGRYSLRQGAVNPTRAVGAFCGRRRAGLPCPPPLYPAPCICFGQLFFHGRKRNQKRRSGDSFPTNLWPAVQPGSRKCESPKAWCSTEPHCARNRPEQRRTHSVALVAVRARTRPGEHCRRSAGIYQAYQAVAGALDHCPSSRSRRVVARAVSHPTLAATIPLRRYLLPAPAA